MKRQPDEPVKAAYLAINVYNALRIYQRHLQENFLEDDSLSIGVDDLMYYVANEIDEENRARPVSALPPAPPRITAATVEGIAAFLVRHKIPFTYEENFLHVPSCDRLPGFTASYHSFYGTLVLMDLQENQFRISDLMSFFE